jgi:diguanylate cyclase (GGDEF)-like protein
LGIVALFITVVLFSTIRLTELGKILADLTNSTIPKISYAASLNTQIQNLATLTSILASSQNSPAQQLARQTIDSSLVRINESMLNDATDRQYLPTQLATLTKEINELDGLVKQRIIFQRLLNDKKDALNTNLQRLFARIRLIENSNEIENMLVEVLLLSVKISEQNRLHEIRQIELALNSLTMNLQNKLVERKLDNTILIKPLERLLFGTEGLINQKVQSLRIDGRTRGRDNFVRNLIADVASNLQYQAYVVNKESMEDAKKVNELAAQYSKLTIISGVFAVLLTLGIIYYLHQRIVLRLVSLSSQVSVASKTPEAIINIDGNDEIARLADTFSLYLERVKEQESALLNMTLTDPLTGIPNRRAFERKLSETIELAMRNKWAVTVILIDVDYFKLYNDHYGHSGGDACLRLVASELNKTLLRQSDFCGRFGGEEFICILPNTGAEAANVICETLRYAIEELKIPHVKSTINDYVTISLGASTLTFNHNSDSTKEILILEADKALYQAKAQGRNRSCFSHFNSGNFSLK